MQIIIPMSGTGNRFIEAGYKDPKPLIEIDGKPIIEHVVNLFPGEENFIFICNSDHLKQTPMREILQRIAPKGKIIEIPPHKKGPVFAVTQVASLINDDEEVIVNYCDFSTYWDYPNFLHHTRTRKADGAVPAYKGFHPHMLGTTNYAFMRDKNQWMLEIKEKEPFTDNRMNEYASNGTYYFKYGRYVKKYFQKLMDLDINLKGEYYVSLIYNLLVQDDLKVSIYNIQHMLQWGTPADVDEYNNWSGYFRKILSFDNSPLDQDPQTLNLIPLAGRGSRFEKEGYQHPKPLIPVSGHPMIVAASSYLPQAQKQTFICLAEHLQKYPLAQEILKSYPHSKILSLAHVTEGQACTVELGLESGDLTSPLLIAACDNGMLWNRQQYQDLLHNPEIDAIVWSFRRHPSAKANPQMYGWIKTTKTKVTGVSVKTPISANPENDHAIVGTFYFRQARFFTEALQRLYKGNKRINNEFYVDSCVGEMVEMGLNVHVFEIDHYICWGTPNDYQTFVYWQSFFHKCSWHPYRLEKDPTVKPSLLKELELQYVHFQQENL